MIEYSIHQHKDISPIIHTVAQFRMEEFKKFPYLYEGSLEAEELYLKTYAQAASAKIILAKENENVIGIFTCIAMEEEDESFQQALLDHHLNPEEYSYFGEAIIRERYRHQGIGSCFLEFGYEHARQRKKAYCCFCAVDRPTNHPLMPKNYIPITTFAEKNHFSHRPEIQASLEWQEIDSPKGKLSTNTLSFFIKETPLQ